MKEFEVYVPLLYNDGRPVEVEKINRLKRRLVDAFGGLTHFPQENEGLWKIGNFTYRDKIVILRVMSADVAKSHRFFSGLKQEMLSEWGQEDVLIVERDINPI
ncbi:MAG TPA: hypothetical protein VMZ27_12290 [Candidatus Saccharimonadales bacterium]|nr:hypothetical protein [Candidatus Saccharimonadales bacterium]